MKIKEIQCFPLAAILAQPYGSSRGQTAKRDAVVVKITTEEGLEGWGDTYGPPLTTVAAIEETMAPLLLGQDPTAVLPLWDRLYRAARKPGWGYALSALDIAMWDLRGKAVGQPIYRLLGGAFRDRVTAYASGLPYRGGSAVDEAHQALQEAASLKEQGFKAFKMRIGGRDQHTDLARIDGVQDVIDTDTDLLMVDAHGAYSRPGALAMGRMLEELDLFWFEEPLPAWDREGYVELARSLQIRVAGGEHLFTASAFAQAIQDGALDILQPEVCLIGGITESHRACYLAESHGLLCYPHCWGTGIRMAATLHLLAAMPDMGSPSCPTQPLLEYDVMENPLREHILATPILAQDGVVLVPQGPGLGVEVDHGALEKYRVE